MGTELGIGEFRVKDITSLLPDWLLPAELDCDLRDNYVDGSFLDQSQELLQSDLAEMPQPCPDRCVDVGPVAQEGGQFDDGEDCGFFLPQAMVVPGALHIVNNALQEVANSLHYWSTWFEQLREFEGLWSCGRLRRFVNYCVRPSALEHKANDIMKTKLGPLYMSPWNEVVKFCCRLSQVLPIVRCTWNQRLFCQNLDASANNRGGQFSPNNFTAILSDPFFFAYFDMVQSLTRIIESLGQWAESCPCHQDIELQPLKSFRRQNAFRREVRTLQGLFRQQAQTCPMRGKRLPELVVDGVDVVLEDLCSLAFTDLLQRHRPLLTEHQWEIVVRDFEEGKSHAQLEFKLKFDWCGRVPYKLAALAHSDQAAAKRELHKAILEFDGHSSELRKHHHPLTQMFLAKENALRKDLDGYVHTNKTLADFPLLEHHASCFRFVQITERSYEAAHSIVKRRVPPNARGPLISLTLRLLNFANDVKIDPNVLVQVAAEFDNVRLAKQIPFLLGLGTHPSVVPVLKQKWKLIKVLNQVIYRSDAASQFLMCLI